MEFDVDWGAAVGVEECGELRCGGLWSFHVYMPVYYGSVSLMMSI